MPNYSFDMQLVVDPFNTSNVVTNGQVFLYDPSDTGNSSPLTITDPNGLPMSNPLMSNSNGFLAAFMVATPQVKWVSAGFVGYFNSYVGMRDAALAAVDAATDAQVQATSAAASAASAAATAATAATTATGGGFAVDPTDTDALLVSIKADGSVVVDATDTDALLITV